MASPDSKKSKTTRRTNQYLRYTSLGLQLLITLAIAGIGGYFLDQWIGWQFPVFLLLFIMVALAGSIYLLIKGTSNE
jgi:hypothetical protein